MKKVTAFVLKVASRCNLNCSYCYMYNMGDNTYLAQPKFMSLETIYQFSVKLQSYCQNNGISHATIIFHGGEPLLLNQDFYKQAVSLFKESAPFVTFKFSMQTNGVTLNEDWYKTLRELNIGIGISFDGPQKYHDKYRVFHNNKGSYKQVTEAIKLGKEGAAIIVVLNHNILPQDFYEEIKSLGTAKLNILFPDGHYDNLPMGFAPDKHGNEGYTPYADWLIDLYHFWKKDMNRPKIYLFDIIIRMVLGEENLGDELVGRRTNGVMVIETDGSMEVADSLRVCYEGATRNKLTVHNNAIEDAFEDVLFNVYHHAHEKVCEKCLNCPIYDICGGGFLTHRYAKSNGFDNPTIYCNDMIRLISFIQNDIIDSLPTQTINKLLLTKTSYQELFQDTEKVPSILVDNHTKITLNSFKSQAI